nr:hypothetical protein [Mesorhizobium sp. LNHC220B00]
MLQYGFEDRARRMPGSADVRRTIEEHCPPGVLPSEEMVNGLYGPGLMDEAEASAAAILSTIDKLQLRAVDKPPAPSIKS